MRKARSPIARARVRACTHHVAEEAQAAVNRAKALELSIMAHSTREIAAILGVSRSTAHGYVADSLAELAKFRTEKTVDLREQQTEQIQALLKKVLPIATKENLLVQKEDPEGGVITEKDAELQLKAVDRATKLLARLSALWGTDAPAKKEVTGKDGQAIDVRVFTVERQAELSDRARKLLTLVPNKPLGAN